MGKYLFFDIDGTLYDPVIHIPDSTKEGMKRLRDNGHHLFISTGRTKCLLFNELLDIGFEGLICGSGTYYEHQGKELFRYEMPEDECREAIKAFHDHNMEVFAEGTELLYCDDYAAEPATVLVKKIFNIDDADFIRRSDDPSIHVSKVSAFKKDGTSDIKGAFDHMSKKYTCVMHGPEYVETITPGFSKGLAIRKLSEIIGFDMNDTYAFGDSMNDLDMLRTVKYGVAMGNSHPEVLKRIPIHTTSFREDGLYNALKLLELI